MSSSERAVGDVRITDGSVTADATGLWRSGDHAAALELAVQRVGRVLHATARRIAGDDAADIVQEALLRVWNHPERFDERRGTLESYLNVTTRGTALDHVRRSQRRREREHRGRRDLELFPPWEPVDPELRARLRTALGALHDDEHDLIAIAFFEGVSYRRIAEELGVPEGTVKSRMRRTLTRLRGDLQPLDHDDDSAGDGPARGSANGTDDEPGRTPVGGSRKNG